MHRKLYVTLIACLALGVAGAATASTANKLGPVSVNVPKQPSVTGNVQISFMPRGRLPHGGYYYAVVVLQHYEHFSLKVPPACATSSDMGKTEYGYPHRGHPVRLTLLPVRSADSQWCPGGTYAGAIYAVPHKPPCSSGYPCYGKSTESGACWEIEGKKVCGVVVKPGPYSYPGGLPKPIDRSTHIVGHFRITFPPPPK